MHTIRAFFRLLRVGLHVLQGAATVALFYPCLRRRQRLFLKRRWSRQLLDMLGVSLRAPARLPDGMLVANHISFLDIFVINALAPAFFVAKDDVRAWPLIGWLCANTDTLFMARGSRSAAYKTNLAVAQVLRTGARLVIFPEGTTTDGSAVLPFRSALFQAAVDARVGVQPLRLGYLDGQGRRSTAPAYVGELSLLGCLWAIACAPTLSACVQVLPPIDVQGKSRNELAAIAQTLIGQASCGSAWEPESCVPACGAEELAPV